MATSAGGCGLATAGETISQYSDTTYPACWRRGSGGCLTRNFPEKRANSGDPLARSDTCHRNPGHSAATGDRAYECKQIEVIGQWLYYQKADCRR
jgi:hypothetical protein